MWKMETSLGTLNAIRTAIARTSPEMIDLGLRIASVKATGMDWGMAGGSWSAYPCSIYLTDAEHLAVKIAADTHNIDVADHGYQGWEGGHEVRKGARFTRRDIRTKFD